MVPSKPKIQNCGLFHDKWRHTRSNDSWNRVCYRNTVALWRICTGITSIEMLPKRRKTLKGAKWMPIFLFAKQVKAECEKMNLHDLLMMD